MSLFQAVRFRELASQLTQQETDQFLLKLVKTLPNLLIVALFDHFKSDDSYDAITEDMNEWICEIIRARKESKSKSTPLATKTSLNNIPDAVIAKIASFMIQTDYANFSKVNRMIFIGCNSPNTLQEIYFDTESNLNHHRFNCDLYPSVKSLYFDLAQINDRISDLNNQSFADQLEYIHLTGNYCPNISDISCFVDEFPKCHNVQQLQCSYLEDDICSTQCFNEILSKFPNIQYLSLHCITNIDHNQIKLLLPSLKGISLFEWTESENWMNQKRLIHSFGDKLHFLQFEEGINFRNYQLYTINFEKLEQLKLGNVSGTSLNDIIKTAKNLKKISISSVNDWYYKIKDAMTNIITSCQLLEFIKIHSRNNDAVIAALQGINNGFNKTINLKRKKMKIEIELPSNWRHYVNNNALDLVLSVTNIINQLQLSQIADFLFIWKIGEKRNVINQIADKLRNTFNESMEIKITSKEYPDRWYIVIMNQNCTINGYNESWEMRNI